MPDPTAEVRAARHWVQLDARSPAELTERARELERRGFEGVVVPQINEPPWATLGAVAAVTDRLRMASGIALAFTRSPVETAYTALHLDAFSGGRFALGLGTSVRSWNVDRFGVDDDRPLARLREQLLALRPLLATERPDGATRFQGEFYEFDVSTMPLRTPVGERVPIWLGALRGPMVELAGELADGLLGHPAWSPQYLVADVRDALARGLAAAGRQRSDVDVSAWLRVAISDDVERAVEDSKPSIILYAQQPQYESYFEAHGFGREAAEIRRVAAAGGSVRDMARAVSDEMIRTFVLIGGPGDVASQIAELLPYVDDLCLTPPPGVPRERRDAYAAAITDHLQPTG